MRAPYLLLDIDGVLIPFPAKDGTTPPTHVRHDVVPTGSNPGDPVTIWLDPTHGPLLMDVARTGLVSSVWCTSWRQDAATMIGPLLGIPSFPYIDLPRPQITTSHPHGYLWKRDHVAVWLNKAPVAWIDDDFTHLDHEWAARRTAAGLPTLLVQPDSYIGLLPEHIATMLEWASGLPSGQPPPPCPQGEPEPADAA
ncbi:HAD domain-containing protein [Streptomyces inhibens]|uniref:HAD domain-containing protein n=1 Tax=Streptomyces inhibens TaxID=2293571 RepID=UPI0036B28741